MVESVACYGCEVWLLKREEQLALEKDYLRSARMSRFRLGAKTATPEYETMQLIERY